jgi:ABC-type multidrug transport system fused ATPase/permease subunit
LTFLLERTQKRRLVQDASYMQNLVLIIIVALATALIAALTWWAWDHVATNVDLLFGLSPCFWMAVLFGGATIASLGCAGAASLLLFRHVRASRKAGKSKP